MVDRDIEVQMTCTSRPVSGVLNSPVNLTNTVQKINAFYSRVIGKHDNIKNSSVAVTKVCHGVSSIWITDCVVIVSVRMKKGDRDRYSCLGINHCVLTIAALYSLLNLV